MACAGQNVGGSDLRGHWTGIVRPRLVQTEATPDLGCSENLTTTENKARAQKFKGSNVYNLVTFVFSLICDTLVRRKKSMVLSNQCKINLQSAVL